MQLPFTYLDSSKTKQYVYDRSRAIELDATLGSDISSVVLVHADDAYSVLDSTQMSNFKLAAKQTGMSDALTARMLDLYQPIKTNIALGHRKGANPFLILESANNRPMALAPLDKSAYVKLKDDSITEMLSHLKGAADPTNISPFLDMLKACHPDNDLSTFVNLKPGVLQNGLAYSRLGMAYIGMSFSPGGKIWGYQVPARLYNKGLIASWNANGTWTYNSIRDGYSYPQRTSAFDSNFLGGVTQGGGVISFYEPTGNYFFNPDFSKLSANSALKNIIIKMFKIAGNVQTTVIKEDGTSSIITEDAIKNSIMTNDEFWTNFCYQQGHVQGTEITHMLKGQFFFLPNSQYVKRFEMLGEITESSIFKMVANKVAANAIMLADMIEDVTLHQKYGSLKAATKQQLTEGREAATQVKEILCTTYAEPVSTSFSATELSLAAKLDLSAVNTFIYDKRVNRKVSDAIAYCLKAGSQRSFIGIRPMIGNSLPAEVFTGIFSEMVANSHVLYTLELRYGTFIGDSFTEEAYPTTTESLDFQKVIYMVRKGVTVIYATEASNELYLSLGLSNMIMKGDFLNQFGLAMGKKVPELNLANLIDRKAQAESWITDRIKEIGGTYTSEAIKRQNTASLSALNSMLFLLDTGGFLNPVAFIDQDTRRRFADAMLAFNDRGFKSLMNSLKVLTIPGAKSRIEERVVEADVLTSAEALMLEDLKQTLAPSNV